MKRCVAAGVLVVLLLSAAAAAPPGLAQNPYVLGPDDVIEVHVYGSEEISRVITVRPDGMISLPMVGEVRAAGLTPEQLRDRLAPLYAAYIKNPLVAVIVREFRRVRVAVLGQVAKPGVYELRQGSGVLDALAAAGGLTDAAGLGQARLTRAQGPEMLIDLDRLLLRGETALNHRVESGDTLVVPEDLTWRVYVLGEVARPGVLPLRGSMTALQALTLAGGPTRRSRLDRRCRSCTSTCSGSSARATWGATSRCIGAISSMCPTTRRPSRTSS